MEHTTIVSKWSPRKRRPKHEAPKTQKWNTQNLKTKHPNLENEAPKTRNHCRLNNYNFMSCMMQSESGGGSGFVCTCEGPQNPSQGFIKACKLFNWTFLDRISCINFITSLAILDTSYLNMHFFSTHTCLRRVQNWPYLGVFKYARAVTQKVWNEAERERGSHVRLLCHALLTS